MIEANKSDSDDDGAEDVSNWEVMENDEVNVSDSMDIVEFDTVATKTVRTKLQTLGFLMKYKMSPYAHPSSYYGESKLKGTFERFWGHA
ncbi:hypothetical protein G6F52_013787 [Rhizopus delemar]|nr:hypothetical protein G6F52_013787 [Rhizopus delemar]